MSVKEVETTISFEVIDENFYNYRGIVLPGGTRSGKTIAILQWIIAYCLRNTNKDIVICRDTLTNLKRTTLKDFQALCYGFGEYASMYPNMTMNKSEMYANINSNTITFIGLLDDPMRVYGLRSDLFYINEAVATYKHTFNQLNQRCIEGFILDCNPSEPNSWVYQLDLRPDVLEYRTTYNDNPFLPIEVIKEIEAYEPNEINKNNGTSDERLWSVYGKGEIYKGKEIIYSEWTTYDKEPDEYDNAFFGLDWGHNHPLAVIKVIINGRDLYVQEIMYKSRIDDLDEVIEILQEQPEINNTYVVCDSSEPRSVNQLIRGGIPAMNVKKPPGSVLDGIRKVKAFNIHVHVNSINIQNELNNYKWKVDTKTDSILDIPVKKHDDALDAIRYPLYTFT